MEVVKEVHTKYTSLSEAASMFLLMYQSDRDNPRIKAANKFCGHKMRMQTCPNGDYEYTYNWFSTADDTLRYVRVRLDGMLFRVTSSIECERVLDSGSAKELNEKIRRMI